MGEGYASSPVCPPLLANSAALSRLSFALCTKLKATSKLNKLLIPSNLEFIIAAFAANSVVGGGPGDIRPSSPGVLGRDSEFEVSGTDSLLEFVYGLGSAGFASITELLIANGDGMTDTGIRMTFLKVERKSRLSASRLILLMKNDSVAASASRIYTHIYQLPSIIF